MSLFLDKFFVMIGRKKFERNLNYYYSHGFFFLSNFLLENLSTFYTAVRLILWILIQVSYIELKFKD